jgi:hypothetical protein
MFYIFVKLHLAFVGGQTKHTTPPPPFHLYITALVQTSVVCVRFVFDAHWYGTGCVVTGPVYPGPSVIAKQIGELYSTVSIM